MSDTITKWRKGDLVCWEEIHSYVSARGAGGTSTSFHVGVATACTRDGHVKSVQDFQRGYSQPLERIRASKVTCLERSRVDMDTLAEHVQSIDWAGRLQSWEEVRDLVRLHLI